MPTIARCAVPRISDKPATRPRDPQGRRLPLFNSKSLVRQCFAAAAMAVFLFMLLLGVLVSTPIAANQTVLVIDCGSTGTRM